MAISTYKTFLMFRTLGATAWQKLIDIKDTPDMGGEKEQIDVTTLSHGQRMYIDGIEDTESRVFTANYDADDYARIKNMEGQEYEFAVWFGGSGSGSTLVPTGSDGAFSWVGKPSVWVNGGAVNEAVEMSISISASTEVEFAREGGDTAGVKLNASVISVATSGTATLVASTTPAGQTVTWSSLDSDVATVSNGVVSGVGAGTTSVIASIVVDGETFYDTCAVKVTAG